MKHSLKDIVLEKAKLSHICNGIVYYTIRIDNTIYQLELDTTDESEYKNTYFHPEHKAIDFKRWIRKGAENGNFIQLI